MIRKILKYSIRVFLIILAAALGLMFLAFCLPTEPMFTNLGESTDIFETEGTYPWLYGTMAARFSNFNDCDCLLHAIQPVTDPLFDMMRINKTVLVGSDPVDSLIALEKGGEGEFAVHSRARYWHGYLVFLKPLLLIFNYSEIRVFNIVVGCLLFILLVYLMRKRRIGWKFIAALTASILMLYPSVILRQISLSAMFFTMEIGLIILVKYYEKLRDIPRLFAFFLAVGMLTSFVDFLTFPMISLGGLLVMLFIIEPVQDWREGLKKVIVLSLAWGLGYIGFWACKWLVGTLILQENVFNEAISQVNTRMDPTGLDGKPVTRIYSLINNLILFRTPFQIIVACIYFVYIGFMIIRSHISFRQMLMRGIPLFLVAMIPIVWLLATSNHAYIHNYVDYRNLFVLIFAFFTFLAECTE